MRILFLTMSRPIADRRKVWDPKTLHAAAAELMEFFYPAHYEMGTALEDVLRSRVLSRQQAATLWLIHSQGEVGLRMRRKEIEVNIRRWFEVTNAALSRSLRAMMRPPLKLIEITEDPESGREKIVSLTAKGRAFLDSAATRATRGFAGLIEEISPQVVEAAILYFRGLTAAFRHSEARRRLRVIRRESTPR
jgi:DNA-binding MarR family transcriptional regulator